MRLKLTIPREPKHKECVSAVEWISSDEILSCGDDLQLLRWNLISLEAHPFAQMPPKAYPTSMHWLPRAQNKQGGSDGFVITSADGKIYLFNKAGRLEKSADAHKGAALAGRWSYDGSTLLTGGEDGAVKLWSRNGMLRSVLSQNGSPVYGVSWSPDNARVVFCCGDNCFIKAVKSQMTPIKWVAHDGIVLCVEWSMNTNLIVTGGEDCKYKVWDGYGRGMFSSAPHDYPVTCVSWNPEGDLFAVGSFNLLRLCDKAGWSHSLEKLNSGSVVNISWSPDSTQLAAACANGQVVHAHLVERRVMWRNFEAVQSKRKSVDVRDVLSDVGREKLEMRDRVTKLALGFGQLVIATTKQCYIFNANSWNTPVITDLKECSVALIVLCEKYFLLVDGGTTQICTYEGRVQCVLRLPGTAAGDSISERTVAISNDTCAIRDRSEHSRIHFFETLTGKSAGDGKLVHTNDIVEIAIDQCGASNERKVAFIDKSFDCFIALVKTYGVSQRIAKIGTMVTNIRFNDQTNILAGLQDNRLVIWCFPAVVFVDKDLLHKTIIEHPAGDFGKAAFLMAFIGNHISVRRSDGSLVPCGVSPFPAALSDYAGASKWDQAIRLCRHIKEDHLWAVLAGMASAAKNLYAAEIAYGALDEAAKVYYLSDVRNETSKEVRSALMSAFTGNARDAENMLVHCGRPFRAILFNISMFRWERALELAVKYKMHLDTVIGYRQKYLRETQRKETNNDFLRYQSEVEIDWEHIKEKIQEDEEKDRA